MRSSALFRALSSVTALSLLLPLGGVFSIHAAHAFEYTQCSDGMDNDHDGKIDFPRDPECDSLDDNSEAPDEGIFVTVTDGHESVNAGSALTYIITLKQQRDPVKLVDVDLHVPSQNSVVSISDDGTQSADGVHWTKVAVFNGNTRKLSVHVVVSPNVAKDQLLIARVIADGNQATDTTMVGGKVIPYPQNQLELSITDNRDHAGPGDVLDYVVFVRNPENTDVTEHVRVKLPSALILDDAPGAEVTGDEIIWKDVTIAARNERAFNFRARVNDRVPDRYTIQVVARAGNVVAYDRTVTGGANGPYSLFSTITDNQDSANRGDLLTYVIHIDNASGRLDPHASIDAAIPRYSEFVSATEGGVRDRENIRWLDMEVAPNGSRDLEFTVRVRSDAPDGALLRASSTVQGQISTDVTQVRGGGYGGSSYVPGNLYAGPLEVEKTSDHDSATAGSSIAYTVTVRNSAQSEIRDVSVNDSYSSSEFSVTDPGAGSVGNGRITWHIDSLRSGESRTFRYSGRLSRTLHPGYEVLNTARAYSPYASSVPVSGSSVDVGSSSPYDDGSYSSSDDGYSYGGDGQSYDTLPQTGIEDFFFGPLENTRQFLTPMSAAAAGNGLPLILWLAVIAAGVAGGAALSKKYMA